MEKKLIAKHMVCKTYDTFFISLKFEHMVSKYIQFSHNIIGLI